MTQTRKDLIRMVYLAARECFPPDYKPQSDDIKEFRDNKSSELYDMRYSELSNSQLSEFLNELNILSGRTHPSQVVRRYATAKTISQLRFYAIACAIEFAKMDTWFHTDGSGRIEAEELRIWLRNEFGKPKTMLPRNLFNMLYSTWINRKCNKIMIEKGWKKSVRTENSFYFEKLTPEQAQHLINVFGKMYGNVKQGVGIDEFMHAAIKN
jgi:hypothetical protein